MELMLHTPDDQARLEFCRRVFSCAIELYVVTAFLTDWADRQLNSKCRHFRLITGKDFGITKKAACEAVMRWLPSGRKTQFMVADKIVGFHPKAVFWKETDGRSFAIIGSSNLSRAAFETNYEANTYSPISEAEFKMAKRWLKRIESQSLVMSKDWLKRYKEAPRLGRGASTKNPPSATPLIEFKLPRPTGMREHLSDRRWQLGRYRKHRDGLERLFRRCATEQISPVEFYEELPNYWSNEIGDRLQGKGWERFGKSDDFRALAQSYMRIIDASGDDRDDAVVEEIDDLRERGVTARKAFLTKMLCLYFPKEYPVWNGPTEQYLKRIKFRSPRGASEGARFVDMAKKLRFALLQNPHHPAKNLAELDVVIWAKYGKRKKNR
jgi:hypothetical protein